MTALITRIRNPWHLATVIEARERVGLPVVFSQHPFAELPFWQRRAAVRKEAA